MFVVILFQSTISHGVHGVVIPFSTHTQFHVILS